MIELDSVHLKNIVTHKDTFFKFEDGISIIRGQNGVGKSVLFSTLSNVLYSNPPLSNKKNQAKVMFPKQGSIEIQLKKDDKKYKIKQYKKGVGLKYDIDVNNKKFETHTISSALDLINNIFPLTENQFYSTCYLNAGRSSSHVLLNGTGPQRKEFFETFFGLLHYDVIYSKLRKKLSELKYSIASENEIKEEYNLLKSNLHNINSEEIKNKENKLLKITDKYNEYKTNLNNITTYKKIKSTIIYKEKDLKNIPILEKEIKEIIKQDNLYNQQDKINNLYKKVEYKKDKLNKKLSKIKEYDINSLKSLYEKIANKYNEINNLIEEESKNKEIHKEKRLIKNKLPKCLLNVELDKAIEYNKKLIQNQGTVDKLKKLKGHKRCPTCNSLLKEKDILNLIKICENQINKYKEFNNKNIYNYKRFKEIKDNFNENKYYSLIDTKNNLEYISEVIKKEYKVQKKRIELIKQIKSLPKYEYKEIKQINKKDLEVKKSILLQLNKDKSNYETLKNLNVNIDKENKYLKYIEKHKDITTKLTILGKEKAKCEENNKNKKRIKVLKEKLKIIEKSKKDIILYEKLCKAYGPKGIRNLQIDNIAQLYATQLNQHANLIFTEDIKFEVFVDANNFNILATRDNITSDVNTLSGAQSKCFQLLNLFVLRTFIPDAYKTDTVILDEMESCMSKTRKHLFANNYLKALKNIVDKIIIVTPQEVSEFYVPNAKTYKIIKKKKVTTLI